MHALFLFNEMLKGRKVRTYRSLVKSYKSYIVFSLSDGKCIVVIRERIQKGQKMKPGAVTNIVDVPCDFKTTVTLIYTNKFSEGDTHENFKNSVSN